MKNTYSKCFNCNHGTGFSVEVSSDPAHVAVQKRARDVTVEFAKTVTQLETLEGNVLAQAGDAIVTGARGERWPVPLERFLDKYDAVPPTNPGVDGTYRNRPKKVLALKMNEPFIVMLPDGVSRLTGVSGDWLLDYGDGSLGIVASDIFDDTYDPL